MTVPSSEVLFRSLRNHALHYIGEWEVYGTRRLLRLIRERLLQSWCIWCLAYRSFRGHIQTQSSIGLAKVDFGPAVLVEQNGQKFVPNPRTIARSLYTEMLQATLPYVDMTDVRIFLMGFDAGEQYFSQNCSTPDAPQRKAPCETSWLTTVEHTFLPVRTRLQEISADNGQISDATPAAIAGVTRKDECTRQKL